MTHQAWLGAANCQALRDANSATVSPKVSPIIDLHALGRFRLASDRAVEVLGPSDQVVRRLRATEAALCVPCFTPGTLIETSAGLAAVETIAPGDKVVTRDNGLRTVRWVGQHRFDWEDLRRNEHMAPVLLRRDALGDGTPDRDMLVSPNHRILVAQDQTAILYEDQEVLAAAKHLVNNRGIAAVQALGVTYLHILFDAHEIIRANGVWTESFQPADFSLGAIGNAQRTEILELFPDLKSPAGIAAFCDARQSLGLTEQR